VIERISICSYSMGGVISIRLIPNFDIESLPYLFVRDDKCVYLVDLKYKESMVLCESVNKLSPYP
jgi:hypothetical protein